LNGFLKFFDVGIINALPKIIGVQSDHANPVYKYYLEPDSGKREFIPVTVKPSVAQAAMIGNPVSMPRVIHLVDLYNEKAGKPNVFFVEVTEQSIMDWQLRANRNGHIVCTHGGESLAGLVAAQKKGLVGKNEIAVLDSTAHALKFSGFQELYFENRFPEGFDIKPDEELINAPVFIKPEDLEEVPAPGKKLDSDAFNKFVSSTSEEIAKKLGLSKKAV
jgi:threonine synthase